MSVVFKNVYINSFWITSLYDGNKFNIYDKINQWPYLQEINPEGTDGCFSVSLYLFF